MNMLSIQTGELSDTFKMCVIVDVCCIRLEFDKGPV